MATLSTQNYTALLKTAYQIGSMHFVLLIPIDGNGLELDLHSIDLSAWLREQCKLDSIVHRQLCRLIRDQINNENLVNLLIDADSKYWLEALEPHLKFLEMVEGMTGTELIECMGLLSGSGYYPQQVNIIRKTANFVRLGEGRMGGMKRAMLKSAVNEDLTIVPIFHPGHAAYAVIDRVEGSYRVAICNGGFQCQLFHGQTPALVVNNDERYLFPCIYTCNAKAMRSFLRLVALVYDRKDKRCNDRVFNAINNLLRNKTGHSFEKVDEGELFEGEHANFLNLEVCVKEQTVGNCSVHNFIQAIRYCARSYANKNPYALNQGDMQRTLHYCQHIHDRIVANRARIIECTDLNCFTRANDALTQYITLVLALTQ